jgi:acyl dehydratase
MKISSGPHEVIPRYNEVQLGDELPALELRAVDRTTLALFAEASGDHNPIHIDVDMARAAGLPDVFAQGMLGMAWLGRFLTNWISQSQIKEFQVRFVSIIHIGETIRCTGKVTGKFRVGDEQCLRIDLRSTNQDGETKVTGEALLVLEADK